MLSDSQLQLSQTLERICTELQLEIAIDPTECRFTLDMPVAVDVEHDEKGNLVGIGVCQNKKIVYFTAVSPILIDLLGQFRLAMHNGQGDMECLRSWGIPVQDSDLVWDTQLAFHIQDSSLPGFGLKSLAKTKLGIEYPAYEDLVGKKTAKVRKTLDQWPAEVVAKYNALDCYCTYRLTIDSYNQNLGTYLGSVELPVARVFSQMMSRGVCVDLEYLNTVKEQLENQQKPLKDDLLNELGPINLNSPKQLLGALNAKGIYPVFKGKPSTDKRAMALLPESPIVSTLLKFGEIETLLSTFVYAYLDRNQKIVHPYFNQTGTRTGRVSCSNPNLLQIPKRTENGRMVRKMFIPRPGFRMGDCDFGQIEPRLLAHLSQDRAMCGMFNGGIDFHDFTAERLSISRERAKVLNLSVGYRATYKSVSAQLKCSKEEAEAQIAAWWAMFPELRRWQDKLIFDSKRSGYCETLLGRRIKVENLNDPNPWKRESAERQLINNITQGSAAEVMKMAMIKIAENTQLSKTFGLLVQVYDELLWESQHIEHDKPIVIDCMINAIKLDAT